MSFWTKFSQVESKSTLEKSLKQEFPAFGDRKLVKIASLSGLLSVVAFNDLVIEESELNAMESALKEWSHLSDEEIKAIVSIASTHAKDLIDLENHIYTNELNKIMNVNEKYYVLESLFEIAASDGEVSNSESEQIRAISKAMKLSRNHFLSARAKVIDKLSILK